MAKEATLQVRMDAGLKKQAEELFVDLGTSFAEAVRIFTRQSVAEKGMPFAISLRAPAERTSLRGAASRYANPSLRNKERAAFARAMEAKHGGVH